MDNYSRDDMIKMRNQAVERARQMQRRSRLPYEEPRRKPSAPAKPAPASLDEPPKNRERHRAKRQNGLKILERLNLDPLQIDPDTVLIVLLIILLSGESGNGSEHEKSDRFLIYALIYLLI